MFGLGRIFLQLTYHCNQNDRENLDNLQKEMQQRVTYLNQHNLDSYSDPDLLEKYQLHSQIQNCLSQDHTGQYILIVVVIAVIIFLVLFRLWTLKKFGPKNLGEKN